MKRIVGIITALTALVVCGCSESGDIHLSPCDNTSLTLELDSGRTFLGESIDGVRQVYWSSGDCIMVNGAISSEAKFDGENTKVAKFDFSSVLQYPYNILYPVAIYKDATTVTLPSLQSAADGTIATNTLPMAACIVKSGDASKLHHLAGVIHLQLRADNLATNNCVVMVEFRGNDGEQVSGDFAIDYATTTLSPLVDSDATKVVGTRVTGELSTEKATDVFVVVPAREYKKGFTIRVINDAGHYLDKVKVSGATIEKGAIMKMPEIPFIPTGTLVGVEIPSGR